MKTFFITFLIACSAHALPRNSVIGDQVAEALRQPHELAMQTIKTLGKQSYPMLEELAFNEKWPMKTRWKAFMLLTLPQGKAATVTIKKALLSKTWYMRSAGLTALETVDVHGAKKWAYQLLNADPALMVRMKALEVLRDERGEKVTELFWKKVYSEDSIHRDQSLWIRADLAKILAERPREKDLKRWVRLLHDSDKKLRAMATLALGKLHTQVGVEKDSVTFWQEKYPNRNL